MNLLDQHGVFKQLVMTAARLEIFANRRFFEPFGISISLAKIINLLKHKGSLTPTEIRDVLGGTKANMTQRLKALEKLGLVKRADLDLDHRSVVIGLTEKGETLHKHMASLLTKKAGCLEKLLNREDGAACQRFLDKINHILDTEELNNTYEKADTASFIARRGCPVRLRRTT